MMTGCCPFALLQSSRNWCDCTFQRNETAVYFGTSFCRIRLSSLFDFEGSVVGASNKLANFKFKKPSSFLVFLQSKTPRESEYSV
mmetsp:Transcript_32154/g.63771  ORF Transcript_32154/g.63771 Transcript_32154/m.63771 type:complete len:85 (+) Transcript_32154:1582-1836(+)